MNVGQNGELLAKVNYIIEQAKQTEMSKKKKLLAREEVLKKEYELREGCDRAQEELEQLSKQKEELIGLKEKEMRSLQSVVDDLDYQVNVAACECSKWSDNAMQIVQHVLRERNQGQLTIEEMMQQFPYLERIDGDCFLVNKGQSNSQRHFS